MDHSFDPRTRRCTFCGLEEVWMLSHPDFTCQHVRSILLGKLSSKGFVFPKDMN